MILLLLACGRESFRESILATGYEFYETPSRAARPETIERVRRALGPKLAPPCDAVLTAALFEEHAESWRFWERLYQVRSDYSYVEGELRAAGLPEPLAALPYVKTRYQGLVAADCSAGPWLLPLDTPGVERCTLQGTSRRWSPGEPHLDAGVCAVTDCERDPRYDLRASTAVAIAALRETARETSAALCPMLAAHTPYPDAALAQALLAGCLEDPSTELCAAIAVPSEAAVDAALNPRR